jgi:malic enzyme
LPAEVLKAYHTDAMSFGRDYIIPKPFDKRLIDVVPKAVF